MTREFVLVQVEGGDRFRAEVDVNADKLDPGNMPLRLAGVFIKHPSQSDAETELDNFLLHTDRNGGGSSHTVWFHGNRTGYRFVMPSATALDFTAERI
jgi:hypothetical protein